MNSEPQAVQPAVVGRAWRTTVPGPVDGHRIELVEEPRPRPRTGELLISVEACGVCRTDLHIVEGDLPVRRAHVVPGHEIVGRIAEIGASTDTDFHIGDAVGVPWLRHTCGRCMYCTTGRENLCAESRYTGWDHDGGFADWAVVDADYALKLPEGYSVAELAPLLCAGIIGYRALRHTDLMTRDVMARELALSLGAESAQDTFDCPPEKLDSAIVFAPIGEAIPAALSALAPGGTLVLAGIHMSDVPCLNYERHLFHEKTVRSIEANTRADARSFLERCRQVHVSVRTTTYEFEQIPTALRDLMHGRFTGAAVIVM